MRIINILLFTILATILCNGQENRPNVNSNSLHQEIGRHTITVGYHNQIFKYKKMPSNNYLIELITSMQKNGSDSYFLTITPEGDSVTTVRDDCSKELYVYKDFEEYNGDFYTMRHSPYHIYCYDSNWDLKWSKDIEAIMPNDCRTIMTITSKGQLLIVNNEGIPNTHNEFLAFRFYDLNGNLILKKTTIPQKVSSMPVSLIKAPDNNYFLAVGGYARKDWLHLSLMKITQTGNIIWSKKYPGFYPHKTILSTNGDLVILGYNSNHSRLEKILDDYIKVLAFDMDGNLKWESEVNRFYDEDPGDIIELKNGNYLFSCSITEAFNHGGYASIFEIDKNGKIIFGKQFDCLMGGFSVPFLIRAEGQITLIAQKSGGGYESRFKNLIQIIKLSE